MEPGTLRVFFLASDLGPTGATRQLGLLAANLPRDRFRAEVGVLGRADTPAAVALREAGIPVHGLPLRHAFDFPGVRKVRQAVADADPAVLHGWGPRAVRLGPLVAAARPGGAGPPRLVASAAALPGGGLEGWLTGRRLRRADRVVAATWADGERYRRLGVPAEHLTRIGPAVAPAPSPPDPAGFRRGLGLPPNSRLIMTAGRLDPGSGLKAAIWSFDMLRYEFPDLYLLIFGEGPDRAGLEEFGRALAFDDFRVRFAGCRPDLPAVLGLAEVVWVPHDRGGVNLALEAMAAGRPVVGWKTAELAEVVDDGRTGYLVSPGERPQVSVKTHGLLTDPPAAARLGAAGRTRAVEWFGVDRMVGQFARLYEELAG